MNMLIVYDSFFGNTGEIDRASKWLDSGTG